MNRILITPRSLTSSPPPELERLRREGYELVFSSPGQMPSEEELLELVPNCVGWLAGVEPVSDAVIAKAQELQVISRNGTGIDNLPLDTLKTRGIAVTKAGGANAIGVAELTLSLILAAARHLPETASGIKAGNWPRLKGREIHGSTAGVVGCGAVGRHVVRILSAMGADILVHDPFLPDLTELGPQVRTVELDELFASAHIITLHCPPSGDQPLIGAAELSRMPPGTLLINTARAGLVDETALVAALDRGQVATYATDVFHQEPPIDRALADHPKVIATSHIGGLTSESVTRATNASIDNLLDSLKPER